MFQAITSSLVSKSIYPHLTVVEALKTLIRWKGYIGVVRVVAMCIYRKDRYAKIT